MIETEAIIAIVSIWSVIGLFPLISFINKCWVGRGEGKRYSIPKAVLIGFLISPIAATTLTIAALFIEACGVVVDFLRPYRAHFWKWMEKKEEPEDDRTG